MVGFVVILAVGLGVGLGLKKKKKYVCASFLGGIGGVCVYRSVGANCLSRPSSPYSDLYPNLDPSTFDPSSYYNPTTYDPSTYDPSSYGDRSDCPGYKTLGILLTVYIQFNSCYGVPCTMSGGYQTYGSTPYRFLLSLFSAAIFLLLS